MLMSKGIKFDAELAMSPRLVSKQLSMLILAVYQLQQLKQLLRFRYSTVVLILICTGEEAVRHNQSLGSVV